MNNASSHSVILGFAAFSGTGKTTLLEKLIPELVAHNLSVAVIKHAHHDFDIDYPGKDSYRLRKSGAAETIVSSNKRWAHIREHPEQQKEPELAELLLQINRTDRDIILVEGFKHESFPRIELHRKETNKPFLYPNDENIIAVASDEIDNISSNIPVLNLNNINEISKFVVDYYNRNR